MFTLPFSDEIKKLTVFLFEIFLDGEVLDELKIELCYFSEVGFIV